MRKLNSILIMWIVVSLSSCSSSQHCDAYGFNEIESDEVSKEIVQGTSKDIENASFIFQLRNSESKRVDRSELTKAQNSNLDYAIKNPLELVAQNKGCTEAGRSL